MESSLWKRAGRFLRERSKNKRWRKVLTVLGAVVVFITAYVLLMPAVTMERKTVCELPEHTHTEECYGQTLACGKVGAGDETEEPVTLEFHCTFPEEVHVHTAECYDSEGKIVCGYADYAVHQHDNGCYEDGRLVCPLPEIEEHEHTESCYQINDSGYICGLEESEAHTHTDACYTEHKELTCEETEEEGHTHTADCYVKEWEAVCGLEESEGHTHTEECYGEDGELVCGQEESEGHTHDEATCYQVTEKLICEKEEHTGHQHDDSCYTIYRELTCGKDENPEGHIHTEGCRGVVKELVCGKEEIILHRHTVEGGCYEAVLDENGKQQENENGELLWRLVCAQPEVLEHVHDDACYQEHIHTEDCYQEGLICGLEEHTHTEDCGDPTYYCGGRVHTHMADCYDGEGNLACGKANFMVHTHDETCYASDERLLCPLTEIEEHTHTEECYDADGNLTCVRPEVTLHTHTEECYGEDGTFACGKLEVLEHKHSEECFQPGLAVEEEDEILTRTYEGDGYIVAVTYHSDADIPEEAELVVEQVTPENGEEHYAEQETRFRETLGDENATMKALLKIGFYLNGQEVEPQSDVTVMVQLLDENGLADGSSVTVVHFGEEETEVLDSSEVENSSTTFQMKSFSEIAIGYRTGENGTIHLSESFEYKDEAFHITFRVEGEAPVPEGAEIADTAPAEEGIAVEPAQPEEAEEEPGESQEGPVMLFEEGNEPDMPEEETAQESPAQEDAAALEDGEVAAGKKSLAFTVTPLSEDSEAYASAVAFAKGDDVEEEETALLLVQALSYSLSYQGKELDLSDCLVTAEVTPAEALNQLAEEMGEPYTIQENEDNDENDEEEEPAEEENDIALAALELTQQTEIHQLNAMVLGEDEKMSLTLKERTMALYAATAANPEFKVQYYANLPRIVHEDNTGLPKLDVIDTTGRALPQNGVTPSIKQIFIDTANGGKIKTETKPTKVYREKDFEYIKAPNINYFNALMDNASYQLKEVWILNEGKDPTSEDTTDWEVITDLETLHFTNKPGSEGMDDGQRYILIHSGTVIRLLYDTQEHAENLPATFYDYDISDGGIRTDGNVKIINTGAQGINSPQNCNADVKYAFGNSNAGTNFGTKMWNGNELNKYNSEGKGFKGCTFGLVSKANGNDVVFNVDAPKVFGTPEESGQIGKVIYPDQFSLNFNRQGDTFTLSSVGNTGTGSLEFFEHVATNSKGEKIWSNNFWPMDSAHSWGTEGHDMKFGNGINTRFEPGGQWNGLPTSDDGQNHNSYFGMHYAVEFELGEDYAGPLEYYFFGDDDMWVFLDDETLICDIGGVHASVGEYVNLWDYLKNADGSNKAGKHTLKFFYTERGASGSTCWMQFTLPSVTALKPPQNTGGLQIGKTVRDKETGNIINSDEEYEFTIHFTDGGNGKLRDDYSYTKFSRLEKDADGRDKVLGHDLIISSGTEFTLKHGEYIVINYLPVGTKYEIVEAEGDRHSYTQITIGGQKVEPGTRITKTATGYITQANTDIQVEYDNSYYTFELPETGGPGTNLYTMAGISLLLMAGLMYRKKFGERRAGSSRN